MAKNSAADASRSPRKTTRGASRDLRSVSPTKISPPHQERVILSPKKRSRKSKKQQQENGQVNGASKALQSVLEAPAEVKETASAVADAVADIPESVAGALETVNGDDSLDAEPKAEEDPVPENAARVTVTQEVTGEGEDEVTHTKVKIDMPLEADGQTLPVDSEEALARAKEIVDAGIALQAETEATAPKKSSKRGRKRKASEAEAEPEVSAVVEEEAEVITNGEAVEPVLPVSRLEDEARPSKRVRTVTREEEVVREKMQRRAIMGLSATIAVGAMIPFLSNLF